MGLIKSIQKFDWLKYGLFMTIGVVTIASLCIGNVWINGDGKWGDKKVCQESKTDVNGTWLIQVNCEIDENEPLNDTAKWVHFWGFLTTFIGSISIALMLIFLALRYA